MRQFHMMAAATAGLLGVPALAAATTATPIQHIIVIMQENRSFDNYFGTYPGADGIPQNVCVPINPANPNLGCVQPFHDVHDVNNGGPHASNNALDDLDDGVTKTQFDGFVFQQTLRSQQLCREYPTQPQCVGSISGYARHDVMGYHTGDEIPNYWSYAQHFVLQDHMHPDVRAADSLFSHIYLTSEWTALCKDDTQASTCQTANIGLALHARSQLPWVNLYQLLDMNNVSWKYYLGEGQEPDCDDDDMTCPPQLQTTKVGSTFNPGPFYSWVKAQGPAYLTLHNPSINQLLVDINSGNLPQVSWLVPNVWFSEHPAQSLSQGMEYVTAVVNEVMESQYWANTAIFISWDDWGGFYDHEVPPIADYNTGAEPVQGFGLRTPGLMISTYANAGMIDSQILSFANYAKLIEDLFANGTRLDPAAMGNPDNRPDIRDALTTVSYPDGSTGQVGDLINEFNFNQTPLPPLVLSTHIPTGITISCRSATSDHSYTCTKPTVLIKWNSLDGPNITSQFTYHILRDGVELPKCVGSKTECKDTPPTGQHFYRAYSIDANNVTSPLSPSAEADAM